MNRVSVLSGLRGLVPVSLGSPVEPQTLPVYFSLTIAISIYLFTFLVTDFSWNPQGMTGQILCGVDFIICAMLLRRYGHPRIAGPFEAAALLASTGLAATIATALLSATGFPLVDDDLIAIDKLLGFQWLDVWSLVQAHGATHWWLNLIYYSLDWQPFLISVLLFVIDRGDRCWTMINAWVGGLVLATLIFPIAPAKGALIYYDVARGTGLHPSAFFRIMQGIRDGSIRAIDNHSVVGMVTFPSFHAAAGVYLAWGAWSVPWLRWPFLMLNGAMIISAIPIGGHYLIDIVGGIAVALITIAAAKRYQQYLRCSKRQ